MGHRSERCQFTSKLVCGTWPRVCFQPRLLRQKPRSCGEGLKVEKGACYEACVHLERVCVSMHVSSYTRAPQGDQFMGQRVFLGKDGGGPGLVFLGATRSFTSFSSGNNATADR